MTKTVTSTRSLLDPAIVRQTAKDAVVKLDPRRMARNPVMMVVEVGSLVTTLVWLRDLGSSSGDENLFAGIEQLEHHMASDEAGAAGDQDTHEPTSKLWRCTRLLAIRKRLRDF